MTVSVVFSRIQSLTWGVHNVGRPGRSNLGASRAILAIVLTLGAMQPRHLAAQAQGTATATPRDPRLAFDRNGASYSAVLPFDQPFVLANAAPAPLVRVTAWFARADRLTRAHCQDLSGRRQIRSDIGNAVREAPAALQAKVDSALATHLYKQILPPGFTDGSSTALLTAFTDTLTSFKPALDSATRARIASQLTERLSNVPRLRLSSAMWERSAANPTTADSFALGIHALPANRAFTFCIESVESIPATDSTAIIGRVANAMRGKLQERFAAAASTLDSVGLRDLQRTLRAAALPVVGDSLVVPATSILAVAPPIDNINLVFAGLSQQYRARCDFASNVATDMISATNLPAEDTRCGSTRAVPAHDATFAILLRRVARDTGLAKLGGIARAVAHVPKTEGERLAALATVALAVRGLSCPAVVETSLCAQAGVVAAGQTPITDPRLATEGNALVHTRTVAELKPWADNLDSTIVRLRDLLSLVNYVAADPTARTGVNLSREGLDTTRVLIERTRAAAQRQRGNLRVMTEAVSASDALLGSIASRVVSRDLTRVGIAATSAASYETRARWHVGQDLGVLHAWRPKTRETSAYVGIAVYFRPVNKRGTQPAGRVLNNRRLCPVDLRCTSLNIGITTSKFERADYYAGVLGGYPLVVGIGTRLGDFVRISYNAPLVYTYRFLAGGEVRRRVSHLNAISLTLDADLREILGGLSKSLFGT